MHESEVRVMLVDDNQDWTHLIRSTLHNKNGFRVVCEVSDGISAIEKAAELQPDLIILDIGLPKLNGIESSRRIASLAPKSIVLFLTENHDPEVIREAMGTGALGYVLKSQAANDLLPAVESLLAGATFISKQDPPTHRTA